MTHECIPAPEMAPTTSSAPSEPTGSLGRDAGSAPGSGDYVLVEIVSTEPTRRTLSIVLDGTRAAYLVGDAEVTAEVWRDVLAAWAVVAEPHRAYMATPRAEVKS